MKKLPQPTSQIQEVLFELINRLYIDRKTMMLSAGVWNLTARISDLRNSGVNIISEKRQGVNKYKREIEFVHYKLVNKKDAVQTYMKMKERESQKPE